MKKTYRVTYEESILRVATIQAKDETSAIDIISQQLENGEHHHAVEVWDHAWSAEPADNHPSVTAHCFECGAARDS